MKPCSCFLIDPAPFMFSFWCSSLISIRSIAGISGFQTHDAKQSKLPSQSPQALSITFKPIFFMYTGYCHHHPHQFRAPALILITHTLFRDLSQPPHSTTVPLSPASAAAKVCAPKVHLTCCLAWNRPQGSFFGSSNERSHGNVYAGYIRILYLISGTLPRMASAPCHDH